MIKATDEELDSAAQVLRERFGGRVTIAWEELPNHVKQKWFEHATCVLAAVFAETERDDFDDMPDLVEMFANCKNPDELGN